MRRFFKPSPFAAFVFFILVSGPTSAPLFAQTSYPNKPITLIIPFPPGGSTDIVGRIVADALGKQLGQPVVVDNKAGAGGAIGAKAIAAAPPSKTLR
jgi:tripartite-type tricarboxylate transporter receptor subunit TctC